MANQDDLTPALPGALAALLNPAAYPHPVGNVELVQTHVSWVLLTGDYAYKIKRPVKFAFLDLTDPQRRRFFCEEELRLNQRFAPELYVDVCEITSAGGQARVGGTGAVIEHAVRMRQFRRAEELDRLLAARAIEPPELQRFGQELADIHARLPVASAAQEFGKPVAVRALMLKNLQECAEAAALYDSGARVRALRDPLSTRLEAVQDCMAGRLAGGRVRECHGDLHARNIVRRGSRLVAFDCLEFEPAFRWIDVADEIAFLIADLDARGYEGHANAFLNGYLTEGGDYQACRVLAPYQCHRALIRAKVTALTAAEFRGNAPMRLQALFESCLDAAAHAIAQRVPRLVLMSGLSGSGKTWLASRLAPQLNAVHMRSDVERKRLAGISAQESSRSAPGSGLYTQDMTRAVYEHLGRCAESVLAGGYDAIVDATFARREDRARFRELAARLGVPLRVVHCHAPREILSARIAGREKAGRDASEANLAVLEWQQAHSEPMGADEGLTIIEVDTTAPQLVSRVAAALRAS